MKPWIIFLSILPFVGGAVARGVETWYASPAIKAGMAFEIIWAVVLFGLFVTILRRLHFVTPGRYTRAPYILLSVVTAASSISYLLSAILLRVSRSEGGMPPRVMNGMSAFSASLSHIDFAFEPAVCLWLIHLRGKLTSTTEGKPFKLWLSQSWKRIVDWSLVAITFILAISMTTIMTNAWMEYGARHIDGKQLWHYMLVEHGLNVAVAAFGLLLSLDIAISLVSLKLTQKWAYFVDPITTRLVVAVLPFVVFRFIESLVITIYPETRVMAYTNYEVFGLITIILNGFCSVGVIGGLTSTITIPNVMWAPGVTGSTTALPVGQSVGYTR